ncbi:hypothetical protein [Cryobacterium sp. GrIS_2_6]|uniref:hypothetical protein n=1 Tax=Cryobacterium sp. GrIS_2_6 TaxID=3162785 RepID=UPI002E0A03EB|nr:hypothetical protein [Cryobacterium psychrotolerans]
MTPEPHDDLPGADLPDLRFGSTLMGVIEELEGGYAAAGRGYAAALRELGYPDEGAEHIAAAFVIEMQAGTIQAAWSTRT